MLRVTGRRRVSGKRSATLLVLPAAAARAGIVSSRLSVAGDFFFPISDPLHHIGGRSALLEFPGHESHVRINVVEKLLVSRAEVIEAFLAFWRPAKAMLGALTVAGKPHFAFPAILRQRVELGPAEFMLPC